MSEIRTISNLRFAPYCYKFMLENGEKHAITLIAIMYNNVIVRLTNYHRYVGIKKSTKHIYQNHEDEVRRICNFLNYVLIDKKYKYNAKTVLEIQFNAVEDYLLEYAHKKNRFGMNVSKMSAEKERCAICMFMANTNKNRLNNDEHYYARKIISSGFQNNPILKSKRAEYVWEYEIDAVYLGDNTYNLIRDIPNKALAIILKKIKLYEPELYFAVILQLTAGLREGEVVNVRRADGEWLGGIRYTKNLSRFESFEIDLTKEYMLRSDGKYTGKIKRKRIQKVYPLFLDVIQNAYNEHLKLIPKCAIEDEGPMFVNAYKDSSTGKKMALSVRSYTNRIKKVFYEYAMPELVASSDIEVRTFAKLVNENSFGLHAFRHWFSVQLVLNDEDLTSIAFWRGDNSLQSAQDYLVNKGELMKRYKKANEKVAETIMNKISTEVFYDI